MAPDSNPTSSHLAKAAQLERSATAGTKRARSGTPAPPPDSNTPERPSKIQKTTSTLPAFYDQETVDKATRFLKCSKFAVVGASNQKQKYGYKILEQLLHEKKNVTPINLNGEKVSGLACLKHLQELPDPSNTAVSIVVPPTSTLEVLKEVQKLNLKMPVFWLQPGAADADVVKYIQDQGLTNRCIFTQPTATSSSSSATSRTELAIHPITAVNPPCPQDAVDLGAVIGSPTTTLNTKTALKVLDTTPRSGSIGADVQPHPSGTSTDGEALVASTASKSTSTTQPSVATSTATSSSAIPLGPCLLTAFKEHARSFIQPAVSVSA